MATRPLYGEQNGDVSSLETGAEPLILLAVMLGGFIVQVLDSVSTIGTKASPKTANLPQNCGRLDGAS
jgi:hypothetical protein